MSEQQPNPRLQLFRCPLRTPSPSTWLRGSSSGSRAIPAPSRTGACRRGRTDRIGQVHDRGSAGRLPVHVAKAAKDPGTGVTKPVGDMLVGTAADDPLRAMRMDAITTTSFLHPPSVRDGSLGVWHSRWVLARASIDMATRGTPVEVSGYCGRPLLTSDSLSIDRARKI